MQEKCSENVYIGGVYRFKHHLVCTKVEELELFQTMLSIPDKGRSGRPKNQDRMVEESRMAAIWKFYLYLLINNLHYTYHNIYMLNALLLF